MKNQSQIEGVVSMSFCMFNKSTLIVTTKDKKSIKSWSMMIQKINIEELDQDSSLKLYSTHSYKD